MRRRVDLRHALSSKLLFVLPLAAACGGEKDSKAEACDAPGSPELYLGQPGTALDLGDDVELVYGNGIQTAGAFLPFRLGTSGLGPDPAVFTVYMGAAETTGARLGNETYEIAFICGNSGDEAGLMTSPGLHIRMPNHGVDLDGTRLHVSISVVDAAAKEATRELDALLHYQGTSGP